MQSCVHLTFVCGLLSCELTLKRLGLAFSAPRASSCSVADVSWSARRRHRRNQKWREAARERERERAFGTLTGAGTPRSFSVAALALRTRSPVRERPLPPHSFRSGDTCPRAARRLNSLVRVQAASQTRRVCRGPVTRRSRASELASVANGSGVGAVPLSLSDACHTRPPPPRTLIVNRSGALGPFSLSSP